MDGAGRRRGIGLPHILLAVLLAAAAAALAACGDEDAGEDPTTERSEPALRVEVDPSSASPGDRVKARVVNDGDDTFTYGLGYMLERREGDSFEKVAEPQVVPMIALVANPGEMGPPVTVRIPKDADAGEYRIVIQQGVPDVGVLSGELDVTSGD